LVTLGIIAELIIFLTSSFLHPEIEETFRYAARYSGRLSLVVLFLGGHYISQRKKLPFNLVNNCLLLSRR
ncbi:MAG: hypothetical protein ACI8RP_001334, partial [Urechidicola sp.]